MAASNAPKHDFAPAWLKIPSDTKPAGSKSTSHQQDRSRQRREENFYNRYGSDYPKPLNRQNSFDLYDVSKRYSPSHGSKYRHHSVEDDYYYYYGYGYNYPYDPYSVQFGSQPSLPRQSARDVKYQHPPSRFSQMNGSYPGYYYYDFYPQGEGYAHYSSPSHSNKRAQYGREGRGESKDSKDSDKSSHDGDDKEKNFNDDFPSLNGTDEDAEVKPSKSGNGGVWDNPPRSRFDDASDLKNTSSGIYKALVPSKPAQQQSPTPPIEILSSRLVRQPKPLGDKKSEFLKALRKEADAEGSATNGMSDGCYRESNNNKSYISHDEAANFIGLLLHKRDFPEEKDREEEVEDDAEDETGDGLGQGAALAANLQPSASGSRKGEDKDSTEVVTNGMSDLHLDHELDHHPKANSSILSSSLEAEQRLLREMGWDEQDDEVYEITEDDKREFKQLTDKLQQQRNGLTRMLPKAWSPQHMTSFKPQPQELNETLSSSDTDSDEDV
ncbi:hypothetical protein BaRGS_00023464 [Batillaria attramentaria]|uniref:Vasculin n=1 Tax=Batillaria attramentaria TaxID=370345 RepID=A0ABD0KE08_9CAEN